MITITFRVRFKFLLVQRLPLLQKILGADASERNIMVNVDIFIGT